MHLHLHVKVPVGRDLILNHPCRHKVRRDNVSMLNVLSSREIVLNVSCVLSVLDFSAREPMYSMYFVFETGVIRLIEIASLRMQTEFYEVSK